MLTRSEWCIYQAPDLLSWAVTETPGTGDKEVSTLLIRPSSRGSRSQQQQLGKISQNTVTQQTSFIMLQHDDDSKRMFCLEEETWRFCRDLA